MPATAKKQPRIEWGHYGIVPRIVRTGAQFKELSHTEKWLYTCLKDLCGDKGTCFRTLESLEEETDISPASLSSMIPHLHEVGLIHAEKKKRSVKGKKIWHITIVDIWQLNREASAPQENSKFENSPGEQAGESSNFEEGFSNFEKPQKNLRGNIQNFRTEEHLKYSNLKNTPAASESPTSGERFSSEQSSSQKEKPLAGQVLDEWDKQNGFPSDRSEYNTKAMAAYVATLITQRKMCLADMARLIALCEELDYVKKQGLTPATFRAQLQAQLKRLHKKPTQASTAQQEQQRTHDSYGNAASAGKSPLDFILNHAQASMAASQ